MRLLLLQNSVYVPAYGGANKSNRLMLEALAARGHDCYVVAQGAAVQGAISNAAFLQELAVRGIPLVRSTRQVDVFRLAGVEVQATQSPAYLRQSAVAAIHELDPTWIVVSSEDPGQNLLEAALASRADRVIFLARTTMALPFGPDAAVRSARATRLLANAAAIVCVSRFLKEYIERWSGCPAEHLPLSFFGPGAFPDYGNPFRGFVTMINPCGLKGIAIFLALAKEHPDVEFAAVPSWGTTPGDMKALEAQPNVRLLRASDDVDAIFSVTRVLLMPSLWMEAWGRSIVEAMLRGIPVLAAAVGGTAEAKLGVPYVLPVRPITAYGPHLDEKLLPAANVPEQDIRPWSEALMTLLSAPDRYRALSTASRDAAHAFLERNTIDPFERFLFERAGQQHSEFSTSHAIPSPQSRSSL